MPEVEKAVEIAAKAHQGQTDKSGSPYILHPIKLVLQMETEAEMKAAALHDVVEDSDCTLEELREEEGFSEEVVEAVKHLTKAKYLRSRELDIDEEDYEEFVDRAKENSISRNVKLADLEHNMDMTRLDELTEDDLSRLERYYASWDKLQGIEYLQ